MSEAAPTVNRRGLGGRRARRPRTRPTANLTWVEAAAFARDTDAVVVPRSELVG